MKDQVYVIGTLDGKIVKIGVSNSVGRRLRQIQYLSPVPVKIFWSGPGTRTAEQALHARFASRRLHGEWFSFEDSDAVEQVSAAIQVLPRSWRHPDPRPTPSLVHVASAATDTHVTFVSGAALLTQLGLVDNITADGIRYIARTSQDWPFGDQEGRVAYLTVGSARTMDKAVFLNFFQSGPKRGGRGRIPSQRLAAPVASPTSSDRSLSPETPNGRLEVAAPHTGRQAHPADANPPASEQHPAKK